MSTQNMLELSLIEILHVINPSRDDIETRMQIIDELRVVVNTIESLRGATVEPFGSFLSQLFTRWGDLDISIELLNGSHILSASKKQKQAFLGDILKALRRTDNFKRVQFVSHARVPILKLESKYQNISCDISINNLSGQLKSKSLLWISLIDRRFRDMVLLVKEWAKANNINSPKTGTLNSYSLSLLVIFHFQTCVPAILPPLKNLYPVNMADELKGVKADVEKQIEEVFLNNIARFRKERRANQSSLSELFVSFLAKFSDLSTRAADEGICTYSGQWEHISTNTRWLPKTYAIFIEDPFEQPENTARAVARGQLTRITEVFRSTHYRLIAPNQNRNFLIPSLVRFAISQYFPGAVFVNPRANGGHYSRNYQNMPRGNFPFIQSQRQPQKTRHPINGIVQNDNQASHGQAWTVNKQSHRNRPGNQNKNVSRQKADQQLQAQAVQVPLPQVKSPGPRTLHPSQASNEALKSSFKASPVQAQQIWRRKESDK